MQLTNRLPLSILSPLLLVAFCLCSATGCGEKNWSYLEGDVQLDGQPFGPGIISFKPADPTARGGGIGEIGADGHFVAKSSGKKLGIAAGDYLIAVSDSVIEDPDDTESNKKSSALPKKYTRTSTSGITRTIAPGEQTIVITLEP